MNVAIVGATGYGGIQAVNLLKNIKKYKISFLGGNKTSGLKWNDNFPFIYLDNDPYIEEISVDNISKNADVALLCLPNGLSSTLTRKLLDRGLKVIDLSADYRYKSLDEWKKVYSKEAAIYKSNDDDLCKIGNNYDDKYYWEHNNWFEIIDKRNGDECGIYHDYNDAIHILKTECNN